MAGPDYESLGLVAPSGSIQLGNKERSALRAVLFSVLMLSAVLVLALPGGNGKQAASLAEEQSAAASYPYPPPSEMYPPPSTAAQAYPPPAAAYPAPTAPEMQAADPYARPTAPAGAALEEAGQAESAPQEEAPVAAPAEEEDTGGHYSVQGFGGAGPTGIVTTGCSGGSCGEAGPTSAAAGLDDQVADYDKLKSERRQAMDFCDAHFNSWENIQKCISELFKNARYRR